tara:strand:+ start:852 stop:1358 length:507 start_codon:yes stop_codon:yes gene_type:complete
MAFSEAPNFDAPIPGQGLTSESGSRPWQSPPEYSTLEEGMDFYISRLVEPKMAARLLDIIETGVPLTALAETLTLGGVMQGLHTVDVGILINPILVELMEGLAKNAKVSYVVGDADTQETPDASMLNKVMTNLSSMDQEVLEEAMSENEEQEDTLAEPKGLMSRKGVM